MSFTFIDIRAISHEGAVNQYITKELTKYTFNNNNIIEEICKVVEYNKKEKCKDKHKTLILKDKDIKTLFGQFFGLETNTHLLTLDRETNKLIKNLLKDKKDNIENYNNKDKILLLCSENKLLRGKVFSCNCILKEGEQKKSYKLTNCRATRDDNYNTKISGKLHYNNTNYFDIIIKMDKIKYEKYRGRKYLVGFF